MATHARRPGRVHVLGDVMLDRYWYGDVQRISPEAPVPIVRFEGSEDRLGGAANVAAGVAAMGAPTTLFGLVGDDAAGASIKDLCARYGVKPNLITDPLQPTTVKLRVLSHRHQMLRVEFESGGDAPKPKGPSKIEGASSFNKLLAGTRVLVLSDYNKGVLRQPQALIAAARRRGIEVLVDPKSADFTKYRGASYLTPNQKEIEAVVGRCSSNSVLANRCRAIIERFSFKGILVTQGAKGMSLITPSQFIGLPAHAQDVFDVTGAGDTVVATLAAQLAMGASIESAMEMANRAAAVAVSKVGTSVVGYGQGGAGPA